MSENAAVGAAIAEETTKQLEHITKPKKGKEKPEPPKIWGSFKKTEFRSLESTGVNISREGRDLGTESENKVNINEQVHLRYSNFLESHIANLQRIYQGNRTLYDQMSKSVSHRYETKLFESVCERDELGNLVVDENAKLKVSEDKINGILGSSEGWELTTMLLEQQTAYQLFALGLDASINPRGNRSLLLENEKIDLGIGTGPLKELYHKYLADYLEGVPDTGGRHSSPGDLSHVPKWLALTGILTGSMVGGAFGGLGGAAVVPGLAALREVLKRGVGMDLRQSGDVLNSIKEKSDSPIEAKYLKELYNIDVADFELTGTGEVQAVNRSIGTIIDTPRIRKNVLGNIYTRLSFYEALGVPASQLDALPEQFLYKYVDGNPEQTATHMQRAILEKFKPNSGSGIGAKDIATNLKDYRKARVAVMSEKIDSIIREKTNKITYQGKISDLQKKLTARENSTVVSGAKEKAEKNKTELNERKALLSSKEPYETYETKRRELDELADKAGKRKEYGVRPTGTDTFESVITGHIDTIDKKLRDSATPPNGLEDQLDRVNADKAKSITTDIDTALKDPALSTGKNISAVNSLVTVKIESIRNQYDNSYRGQIDNLTKQIEDLKKQRDELIELRAQFEESEKQLAESEKKIVFSSSKNLVDMAENFRVLTTTEGSTISEVDLQNLPLKDLLEKAKKEPYNKHIPKNIRDNEDELRAYLIKAQTEARAHLAEIYDLSPGPQQKDYDDFLVAIRGSLNLDNLLTLTGTAIDAILSDASGLYKVPSEDVLEVRTNLVAEARKRLRIRSEIFIDLQSEDLDNQIKAQDEVINQSFDEEKKFLKKTIKMVERQGQIFYSVNAIFNNPADILSSTIVDPKDETLTVSERGGKVPQGYINLMNIFYGYQQDVNNRDTDFAEIMKILPPNELAKMLNIHLSLGFDSPFEIEKVLEALQKRITTQPKKISKIKLQQGFAKIINFLVDKGKALS